MKPDLAALIEEARRGALERFRLLQPHLAEGRALTEIARTAGVPYATAKRWVARYWQFGLVGLARKGRADQGERRALSPELLQVIEGLALERLPRSVATVHRAVFQLAQQQGCKPPSYSLVHQIIQAFPADLRTLVAREAFGEGREPDYVSHDILLALAHEHRPGCRATRKVNSELR